MTAACGDDGTEPAGNGGQGNETSSSTSSGAPGEGGGGSTTSGSGGAPSSGEGGAPSSGEGGAPSSGEGGAPSGEGGSGSDPGTGGSPPAGDPACSADTAAFRTDVAPILNGKCASCHGNMGPPSGGLDLRANNAYKQLTEKNGSCGNRKIVVPGKPSESYLLNKLTNKDICPNSSPMPPPPSALLTAAETKKINDWICAGAPDN